MLKRVISTEKGLQGQLTCFIWYHLSSQVYGCVWIRGEVDSVESDSRRQGNQHFVVARALTDSKHGIRGGEKGLKWKSELCCFVWFFKGNIGKRMKNIEKRVLFGVEHFFFKRWWLQSLSLQRLALWIWTLWHGEPGTKRQTRLHRGPDSRIKGNTDALYICILYILYIYDTF